MKKISILLAVILGFALSTTTFAQGAPPPPPSDHGTTGNSDTGGGGAPIGSGVLILLGLGTAYGGKKLYDINKENLEE